MGHDARRAATALLACVAVALAAILLPAAGIGSYPGVVGDSGPGVGPGEGQASGPGDAANPNDGATGTDGTGTDGTDTNTGETGDQQSGNTDTAGPPDGDPGLSGVGGLVVGLLRAVALIGFGATALVVGGLLVGGLRSGPICLVERRTDGRSGGLLLEIFGRRVSVGGLRGIARGSMRTVLGLGRSVGRLLRGLETIAASVGTALAAGVSNTPGVRSTLGGVARRVVNAVGTVGRAIVSLSVGVGTLAGGFAQWRPSFHRGDSPAADARDAGPVPEPETATESAVTTDPRSVEEAWERFVDRVSLRRPEARTPGEVARTAVRNDWPASPVRRLTNAFREVRYGGATAEDRTDRAVGALDRMSDGNGDGDGSADATGDGSGSGGASS